MLIQLKQLKQKGQIIFPQTTSEAVLVKTGGTIVTLDKVLHNKIDTITSNDSNLTISKQGSEVSINHSSEIDPNNTPEPLLVQHDNTGHIINKKPMGLVKMFINNEQAIETYGTENQSMVFGDEFIKDNIVIKLKWDNINGNT